MYSASVKAAGSRRQTKSTVQDSQKFGHKLAARGLPPCTAPPSSLPSIPVFLHLQQVLQTPKLKRRKRERMEGWEERNKPQGQSCPGQPPDEHNPLPPFVSSSLPSFLPSCLFSFSSLPLLSPCLHPSVLQSSSAPV